jgi:hypothetical protein
LPSKRSTATVSSQSSVASSHIRRATKDQPGRPAGQSRRPSPARLARPGQSVEFDPHGARGAPPRRGACRGCGGGRRHRSRSPRCRPGRWWWSFWMCCSSARTAGFTSATGGVVLRVVRSLRCVQSFVVSATKLAGQHGADPAGRTPRGDRGHDHLWIVVHGDLRYPVQPRDGLPVRSARRAGHSAEPRTAASSPAKSSPHGPHARR